MARSIALLSFAALFAGYLVHGLPQAQAQLPTPLPTPQTIPEPPTIVAPSPQPLPTLPAALPGPSPNALPPNLLSPIVLPPGGPLDIPRPNAPKPRGPFNFADRLNELRTASVGLRAEIIREMSDTQRSILPNLVTALKTESDPLVKSAIAEVLASRWKEATPALEPLITMLSDRRRAIVPRDSYANRPTMLPGIATLPWNGTKQRYPSPSPGNPTGLLNISAIEALGNIGLPARDKATPPLKALLQDENPLVRINAAWALLEVGADVPIIDTWLAVLQSDDPNVQQAAVAFVGSGEGLFAKALGSEATPKMIKPLVDLLGHPEDSVRSAIRSSLKLFGPDTIPELTTALDSPKPLTRLNAAQLLGSFGPKAAPATASLIKRLNDPGEYNPPPKPYDVIPSLAAFDEDYWSSKPSPDQRFVRVNAALALGSIANPEAIPALKNALIDPYVRMQLASAWALIKLDQTEPSLPILGKILQSDPDPETRYSAERVLRNAGDPGKKYLLPLYLKRFDATKPESRESAVIEFSNMGFVALPAVARLRQTLEGPDLVARGYAVTVLANIYEDITLKNQMGQLSTSDRTLAVEELKKILTIITKPGAKFNQPPVDRLRTVQTKL